MIKFDHLSYSFPQKDLYHKISFTIEEGQHCALIGTSGGGKSTLVNLIRNPENYMFDGKIGITSPCRIGYVSQFSLIDAAKEFTVLEYAGEAFIRLEAEIAALCLEMETSLNLEPVLERYQQTLDTFSAMGGDDYENMIDKKLNLANLGRHKFQMVSALSGGEFKLLQVIKEMLCSPDLLIMDEPDSYLDFEHINSLKNLINSHKETLLIITHNRYLLNHCFNKILHLENKELQEFDGSYVDYNFSLLQSKIELQELAKADAEEIQRTQLLIDKLRAKATFNYDVATGKSLHAREKILERLDARRIKAPFVDIKQPDICFAAEPKIEDAVVLNIQDYSISFDDVLLENINLEMKATDKVALVGPNGSGKTTLLREIYHNRHDAITIKEEVNMAYLSQLPGETMKDGNTILEEFFDAGFQTVSEIAAYLSGYGFEEESMTQQIHSLSGGEKNTLQLAKAAASKANLLLLDEPASHLDTYSQLALETALKNYNGAILMVSHDFYSIVNCTDYIFLIEDKTIRKISTRKFRKMIYANYFDCGYLEKEQKKKALETKIESALRDTDFELAKTLSVELEALIQQL